MKIIIIRCIPALIALAALGFSEFSRLCSSINGICYRTVIEIMIPIFTYPLYFFSLYFLPIALILIFVPWRTFVSWLKMARWMLPLLFIAVATEPVSSHRILSTNRDDTSTLAGQIFAICSLLVFIYTIVRNKVYEHDTNKYDVKYAEANKKDISLLFAASIGLIATAFASWALVSTSAYSLSIDLTFFILAVSILSNLYALSNAIVISYKKMRDRAPFGSKVVLSQTLLAMSAVVIALFISKLP